MRHGRRRRRRIAAWLVGFAPAFAIHASALDVFAQHVTRDSVPDFASPFLPPGHWAVDAARRLNALGLVEPGFDRSSRTITRRETAMALCEAVTAAEAEDRPRLAALARGFLARFAEEFPATVAAIEGRARSGPRLGAGSATGGFEVLEGRLLAGAGYANGEDWTGPARREDVRSIAGGASWSVELFPLVAATAEPSWSAGDWTMSDGYATVVWHSVGLWAGRRFIVYAPGQDGVVLDAADVPFNGGGVYLADPVELPGLLRHLGPLRFEMFLSRVDNSGPVESPWMWGMHAALAPHPRLQLGVNRAAMFGGEGETGVNLRNVAYLLIGKHGGGGSQFGNQIVALELWYRPPLGSLAAAAYVEWGFEDNAGAWHDVPGYVAGLEVPAIPGLVDVAAGVERASFSRSCCGNPIWYRHWWFDGGWTDGGIPLGHPLGGHGSQWRVWARAALDDARVRLQASALTRVRGEENLFAPDREGHSVGGALGAELRLAPHVDIIVRGAIESGEGNWTEAAAFIGGRLFF